MSTKKTATLIEARVYYIDIGDFCACAIVKV
jgi:hypothetical protein